MLQETLTMTPLQWVIASLGAVMIGMAKTGIAGLSILFVAAFAAVLPSSKQASGIVLPLLILGDWIAVVSYRRHLEWRHLRRLFPWAAAGVVLGYFAMGALSNRSAKTLIGAIIVSLALLSYWQRHRAARGQPVPVLTHWSLAAAVGVVAGFTTLIANAAGPLMAIYLLSMRLPKMEYVGTAAVFFALLNLFKVPFMVNLGLIGAQSLTFNLILAPGVILGTFAGRWLLMRIDQRLFEQIVLGFCVAGGLILLW
jgi:uncharacterized membrane protein YfcA